jgi:hypothetical protein
MRQFFFIVEITTRKLDFDLRHLFDQQASDCRIHCKRKAARGTWRMKRFMRWAAAAYFTIGILYAGLWIKATNASLLWCAFLVFGWLPWQIAPDATGTALMAVGLGKHLFVPR